MAATRDRAQRIQSIPSVWATPKRLATAPPTSAPTAPSTMVHRIEMFCSPRMTRRARAPSTAPAIIIPMNDSMMSSSEKVR